MWEKCNEVSVRAWLALEGVRRRAREEARRFAEDDRGLSGVVVAVLLILVAVLAVVMLWGGLKEWLVDMWARITGSEGAGGITGGTLGG